MGPVKKISKIAIFASKYDCSILCSFRDMTFFAIFSKVFSKLKLLIFFKNLKFLALYLGTVRVLSKIANLALKHDCSNPCSFRDTFFLIFSKSFLKTYMIFLKLIFKIWNSQPCSWVLSDFFWGVTNLANKYDCSNPCSFRDMTFFVIFFQKVFWKLIWFFFAKSEIPNPEVGSCQKNLKDCESCLQIWLFNSL